MCILWEITLKMDGGYPYEIGLALNTYHKLMVGVAQNTLKRGDFEMKNKYLYTIIFVGLMLSGLAAPVSAVNLDQNGCENTLFGTWSNNTCTVYSTINTPIDIIIPIQTILELHGSVVTNYINNMGTINIYGTLNNTWFINNTGIINNKCGGTFIGDTPIPNPIVQETPCIYINIDLSPDTASNPISTEHTVTATVIDSSGNTYEGILVIFSIIAGPNSPWNSTGTTNASGKATFTYTGDGGIGTDSIRAFIYLNDTIESDIVTKEWTEQEINGFMTGGGSVLKEPFVPSGDRPGKPTSDRVTHGFELNCDASKTPNNLEVNWGKGNRFHLDALTFAVCSDDPSIVPNPPMAGFDTIKGTGTGNYNGVSGATVRFVFTDAGEPGKNDIAVMTIMDASSNIVLQVKGNLNNGNQQAHED